MPLFSIIVPVYNVEEYLRECIESILLQDFSDYEIILVNDGSTDGSGVICDEYAGQNDKISIIHKKNEGIAFARNTGMAAAEGDYIIFIDSDDFMQENVLSEIAHDIQKNHSDVITLGITHYDNITKKVTEIPFEFKSPVVTEKEKFQFFNQVCRDRYSVWSIRNVYKTSFLKENELQYKDLNFAEDCEFYIGVLKHVKKVSLIKKSLIYYRINRYGSLSNTMNASKLEIMANVYSEWFAYLDAETEREQMRDAYCFLSNAFFYALLNVMKLNDERIFETAQNNIRLLNYVTGWKKKLIRTMFVIFGVKRTKKMIEGIM